MPKTEKTKTPKITPFDKGPRDYYRGSLGIQKKPFRSFVVGKASGGIGFRRGAR